MISLYKIKPAFQKLLLPVLRMLHKLNVTANQLTIAAVFLSIGMGASIYFHSFSHALILIVPIGYILRMALNALDGMMATHYDMKSNLGEVLNELGDVISDLVIVFPMVVIPGINPIIIVVFAILSTINEYAGILGKAVSGERRYEGPMGKSDRAFVVGGFVLIYFFWDGIINYSNFIFGVSILLIVISTLVRLKNSLK